ncbi:MAG: NAD+ synthase, partial [Clostridia bacterium]|nr:NAD+ synthase [Clostridia bacterium]
NICEDIWYANGPTRVQALAGDAEVVINLSSSPFHAGKGADRETMLRTRATDNAVFVVYANLVGGQDELVFDGNSLVIDAEGTVLARGLPFEEDLVVCDLDLGQLFNQRLHDPRRRKEKLEAREAERLVFVDLDGPAGPAVPPDEGEKPPLPARSVPRLDEEAEVYAALVLGCRDYVRKNGFAKVVVGLSGGIDSALTAVVAVDALGAESVVGLRMPSPFSSEGSLRDAAELADNLGIVYYTIPIDGIFAAYRQALAPVFGDLPFDVTEENIQARIRGNLLMALSNKFGWLVLPTGNKSELGVGYATLYGDMAGGFSLLKDVPKTLVYRLAAYRNRLGPRPVIPQAVFEKPPSAELRPDQKDEDTLPPYAVLDPILRLYVERDLDVDAIVARGFPEETVRRVARMVDRNEYKRRQAAPGPKITPRAFGRDRRYPITNRFQG